MSVGRGGVFKYFTPEDALDVEGKENKYFSVVKLNDQIVALAGLQKDPYQSKNLWISFISVGPKYQSNRYASRLVEEIFSFAKNNDYSLHESAYSEDGLQKLKKIVNKFAKETKVKILDNKGIVKDAL